MEMPLGVTEGAEDELEHCQNENISFYSIPQQYVKGEALNMFRFQYMDHSAPTWKKCTSDTAKDFSAMGYYVAKRLQKELKIPIGVIGCNWGCRTLESFIPSAAFDRNNELAEYKSNYEKSLSDNSQEYYDKTYEDFKKFLDERAKNFKPVFEISYDNSQYGSMYPLLEWKNVIWPKGTYDADRPGCVWHNMLEDIAPYSLSFVIWYQGEAYPRGNYADKYGVMVNAWREAFKNDDLAFYAMELPPYGYGGVENADAVSPANWATLRKEQRKATLENKNCHLITSAGLGDINNIHPTNKREFAYRTARSVLYHTYGIGKKYENPYAISAKFEGSCVRIKFANDENLVIIGHRVAYLFLSENSKDFVIANGRIENGELVVSSPQIKNPREVRYCYSTYYEGQNIFNSVALPASPFRFVKEEGQEEI